MGPTEITINAQRCCKITNLLTGQEMDRPALATSPYWRSLFEYAVGKPAEFEIDYDCEPVRWIAG